MLATGGMAALWERTTNPRGAVGAGLLLAARGRRASWPTSSSCSSTRRRCAATGARDGFLITEAVRGEGATLHDADGERFVDELAPRDEVALRSSRSCGAAASAAVSLDMRSVDSARFPNIAAALEEVGIDPRRDLVPVAPAAHYTMGGSRHRPRRALVAARPLRGRRVRLHGPARRQPAGVELARRVLRVRPAGRAGRRGRARAARAPPPPTTPIRTVPPPDETRAALWRLAGLQRDAGGLRELLDDPFPLARLIAASCLAREESRGAHQRMRPPRHRPRAGPHAYACGAAASEPRFEQWT